MINKELTIIDEYLIEQKEAEKKYGKDVIILIEIGQFYEVYENNEKIGKAKEVSELLNIQLTKKNKNIIEVSNKNPYLCGVPSISLERHLETLKRENKYTIIIKKQVGDKEKNKKMERIISEIISPGISVIDNNKEDNKLLSLFVQNESNGNFILGVSSIDLSTGDLNVEETIINNKDKGQLIDELIRNIKSINPNEVIISGNKKIDENMDDDELKFILNLDNCLTHINFNYKEEKETIKEKNIKLNNIFNFNDCNLTPIEQLNLETKEIGLINLMILFNFVKDHNESLLKEINKPDLNKLEKLILENNAIDQLNIINKNSNLKNSSILRTIDSTLTAPGRRLLKKRLLNPISDEIELKRRFDLVDEMSSDYFDFDINLKNIKDIEKKYRKLFLKILNPSELAGLKPTDDAILNLLSDLKIYNKNSQISKLSLNDEKFNKYKNYIKGLEKYFNYDEMSKHNLNKITGNFFNKGVNKDIDKLENDYNENNQLIEKKVELIKEKIFTYSGYDEKSTKISIKVKEHETLGLYLSITNNMYTKYIKNKESNDYIKENGSIKEKKSEVMIKLNSLDELYESNKILSLLLFEKIKEEYLKMLDKIILNIKDLLLEIVEIVAEVDVISSSSKLFFNKDYVRPEIVNNEKSFVEVTDLRHPIVEQLTNEYIPNNLTLNNDEIGNLIYGTNASGKSTIMKALGTNIVLAQAGFFVSASSFKFKPYKKIFTRISGEDNIFKGQSSFEVEMIELRNILERSDKNTLVLGDEISKGTESTSGISITSAAIQLLNEKKSSFLFATHLHEVADLKIIKDIDTIKIYHLKVIYENDKLIYDRKLETGNGERLYGLEVAKSLGLSDIFLKKAQETKNCLIK
jgi:DNA mismatch repair protein MutS